MSLPTGKTRTALTPVVAFILAACASSGSNGWVELEPDTPGSGPTFHLEGTVHHLEIEGGLFVIRDAEGTQYNPANLPDEFRGDGMAVEADARRRDDMASIGMVGPIIELLRIRRQPGAGAGGMGIRGSAWFLETLAGVAIPDSVQATLAFDEQGKVSGNGSCNHFNGTVTVDNGAIMFGPSATTRKFCGEDVMRQETQYLAALQRAERFEIKDELLYVYSADEAQLLRFISADE